MDYFEIILLGMAMLLIAAVGLPMIIKTTSTTISFNKKRISDAPLLKFILLVVVNAIFMALIGATRGVIAGGILGILGGVIAIAEWGAGESGLSMAISIVFLG